MKTVIFCSNFDPRKTHEDLAEFFAAKGFRPTEVSIISTKKGELLTRPFAFLHFDGDLTASDVVAEVNGTLWGVRRLIIRAAHSHLPAQEA